MCRLQLRLPSGGKSVIEMRPENSLGMLRERVAEVSIAVHVFVSEPQVC